MNEEDIIKLARSAGLVGLKQGGVLENFQRFAALVAAAEREACAKVAESFDPNMQWSNHGVHIANTIRSRGVT